jgi:hypothetical protein
LVHCAFQGFQAIDVPFSLTIAPLLGQSVCDGVEISPHRSGETVHCVDSGLVRVLEPDAELLNVPALKYAPESHRDDQARGRDQPVVRAENRRSRPAGTADVMVFLWGIFVSVKKNGKIHQFSFMTFSRAFSGLLRQRIGKSCDKNPAASMNLGKGHHPQAFDRKFFTQGALPFSSREDCPRGRGMRPLSPVRSS